MKIFLILAPILLGALSSCVSSEAYDNWDERRTKRLNDRQERTDAWFDRKMGFAE